MQILQANQTLFKELLKVTQAQYQTGQGNQSDVFQAQLELSKLKDQQIQIQQQIQVLRAQLGRWIGVKQSTRPLALALPKSRAPASLKQVQTQLLNHPLLGIDAAMIAAACSEADYAKEVLEISERSGISKTTLYLYLKISERLYW